MKYLLTLIIATGLLSLAACMGEEDFSTSTQDKLEFSTDTVAFDTVIAGEATNTYTFQVFNHNKKALRIKRIALGRISESPFAVNVDGTWLNGGTSDNTSVGPSGADAIMLSSGDSLRVFVQLLAPPTDQDLPQAIEDQLTFTTEGGAEQSVVLTAASQDVNVMHGEVLTENTVFKSARPYQIYDSLVVAEGVQLTIEAGTRLYFHPDAELRVRGKLVVKGTMEAPVTFRGDRLGNMFDGQPYDRVPGQWGGIVFTQTSTDNDLTWCDIHSGKFGIRCDSTGTSTQKLIIDNSIIHNVSMDAFSAKYSKAFVGNCQITNAGGNCLMLTGGDYTFVHCTIGQFYAFVGGRGVALQFTNYQDDTPIPLENCTFVNCLISGYNDDDVMGDASERHTECPFVFAFKNCLLNTPKIEEVTAIADCLFEDEKDYNYKEQNDSTMRAGNFLPKFDLDALLFPFTLNPKSRAVNAADANLTRQSGYLTDLRGRSRMADGKPDIGAYEAITEDN